MEGYSQYYAKLNHLRPLGYEGYIFKTALAGECGYITEPQAVDIIRLRFNVGLSYFTPRQDEFLHYTMIDHVTDYGWTDKIDYQFRRYEYVGRLHFGAGIDLIKFNNILFNPYIGTGLELGLEIYEIEYQSSYSKSSMSDGSPYIGGNIKIGVDYSINEQFGLMFEYTPSLFLVKEYSFIAMNQFGLIVRF
jgi:hypothetical protein